MNQKLIIYEYALPFFISAVTTYWQLFVYAYFTNYIKKLISKNIIRFKPLKK